MHALPTPKQEAWKYTNLPRALEALQCTPLCTTLGCLEAALPVVSGPQMVFHNGTLAPMLSQSAPLAVGVTLNEPPATLATNPLDELDTLAAPQHYTLHVTGTVKLPLHLIHACSGQPSVARFSLVLEDGAELTLIEHQVAAPRFATWQHLGMEIQLGQGAKLTHSVLQTLPPQCIFTRRTHINLANEATYNATTWQQGAALARIETYATLATATQFSHVGLSLARRQQHHANLLHIAHEGEANQTHIRQRNLLEEQSHGVFQGKFYVAQAAQKTNAYMHCHNMLLSDDARASHKPELEIYADDVKCSHGAATGGLNAEQLFYLQARGLTPQQARALLTAGYAEEFLNQFPASQHQLLKTYLTAYLTNAEEAPEIPMDISPTKGDFLKERAAEPVARLHNPDDHLHSEE